MTNMKYDYLNGVTDAVQKLSNESRLVASWVDVGVLSDEESYNAIHKNAEIGTEGYISIVPDTASFISNKYRSSQQSVMRQRDKTLLMLTENELADTVLNTSKLFLYPHHLIIVPKNASYLEFWTQKYNGRRDNMKAKLLHASGSLETFPRSVHLFPNKLRNLRGRCLKVASISYLPYIQSRVVGSNKGNVAGINSSEKDVFYEGTEAYLITELCRLRNCTLQVEPHGPDRWGGVYQNGSSDGMIGSVYRKETELAIGCIYNWYNEIFDVSQYIAKSAVTLLTPTPLLLQPYQAIVMPFSNSVWALIVIAMSASSIFYHWLSRRALDGSPTRISFIVSSLRIVAIFFQQPHLPQRFTSRAVRICIGFLLIATIILENSYTGKLKSLLTIPQYTEPIDTVLKFANSNLKWIAPAPAWVLTITESQIPHEQILVAKFKIKSYSESRNLTFNRSYGIGIERLNSGLYSFGNYIQPDALINLVLKDDIYYEYTRAIAIRGWPLMNSLNKLILEALEHGLLIAWEKMFVRKYLDPKTEELLLRRSITLFNKPSPTILNLSHVSGIFLLLVLGYVLGLISFATEIVVSIISKKITNRHDTHPQCNRQLKFV